VQSLWAQGKLPAEPNELFIRLEHKKSVTSLAFSPDGHYILSGHTDNTLRLWHVKIGKQINVFRGHKDQITSVTFSPDGRYVLSGSLDKTIRLWEVKKTGKQTQVFEGHTAGIGLVMFLPDGLHLLSGSWDHTLRLWDIETGKEIQVFEGDWTFVNSIAFNRNGRYVVSGSTDNTLRLWEVETGEGVQVFKGHTDRVTSVVFSPYDYYVLSGSLDKTLRLWGVETGKEIRIFEGHTDQVISVAFSPDGRYVLSGSTDQTLRLWNIKTGEEIRVFEWHTDIVRLATFSPDGRHFVSGSWDGTLRLWETNSGKRLARLIALAQDNWIIVTSENYYNCSTGARRYIYQLFENRFRRSDLVTHILRGPVYAYPETNIEPISGQIIGPDITIYYSGQDTQTPTKALIYSWRIDGGDWTDFSKETQAQLRNLTKGFHVFEVRALDTDGNFDLSPARVFFRVLEQSPEVHILNSPEHEIASSNYTFEFIGFDWQTETSQLEYSWRVDEGAWSDYSTNTKAHLTQLIQGKHLFEVRVKDTDEHIASAAATFTVAKQFPEIKILFPPQVEIVSTTYTFQFRGSDLQTPTNQLQYSWQLDDREWSKFSHRTSVQLSQLGDGRHLFRVRVKDSDNHVVSADAAFTVALPKPPETKIITKPDRPIKYSSYTFKFSSSQQSDSETIGYHWRLDKGDWKYGTDPAISVTDLTNGWHILEARAMDEHERIDKTPAKLVFEVQIDEQTPQIFIEDFLKVIKEETYTFRLRGEDLQSNETGLKYSWKLDDGTWTPFTHNQSVVVENLTNGSHILCARCKDPDENISSEKSAIFKVEIEEQNPTIQNLNPYLGILKEPRLTIALKGHDLQTPSEQLEYSYKIDEGEWIYSNESIILRSDLKQGEHVLSVKVRDADGYESKIYKVNFSVNVSFYRRRIFWGIIGGIVLAGLSVLLTIQVKLYLKRKHALRTKYNPYTPGGPVMEESRFFGRTEFLQEIKASIHNMNFIIMGDNRIGKTSVLHRLADELKTMGAKEYLYLPFYIDISDIADEDELFEKLVIETASQVVEYHLASEFDTILKKRPNSFYRFQALIGAILKKLEERGTEERQIRLVFMLDECDTLNDLGERAKSRIRTIFTQRYAQNVTVILTGVNIYLDEPTARKSPWWNPFVRRLMTPFTEKEARDLIKEPAGNIYRFENEAIDKILDWSEKNPFLVQLLCHGGVNRAIIEKRFTITESDIKAVISLSEKAKESIRKAPTIEEIEQKSSSEQLQKRGNPNG